MDGNKGGSLITMYSSKGLQFGWIFFASCFGWVWVILPQMAQAFKKYNG